MKYFDLNYVANKLNQKFMLNYVYILEENLIISIN